MKNIVVLISGSGSNLQAIIDACGRKQINGTLRAVFSNKADAFGLERARLAGIPAHALAQSQFADREAFDRQLMHEIDAYAPDLVVLAGFLSVLGPSVIEAYPRRILNVHPALIPSFCGPGMYGLRPHEAALARGCKVTGATVHFVNEECDGGPILLQKAVDILPGDTPEVLQKRVMEQAEWQLLPLAAERVCAEIIREKEQKND